jgi:hypothetical protein
MVCPEANAGVRAVLHERNLNHDQTNRDEVPTMTRTIIGLSGNLERPSKTRTLVQTAVAAAASEFQAAGTVYELADLPRPRDRSEGRLGVASLVGRERKARPQHSHTKEPK